MIYSHIQIKFVKWRNNQNGKREGKKKGRGWALSKTLKSKCGKKRGNLKFWEKKKLNRKILYHASEVSSGYKA